MSYFSWLQLSVLRDCVLAYWPTEWKIKNKGITPEEASVLRQHYAGLHNLFTTSDGETLFLRRGTGRLRR